jgi:hypothetical protein
VKTVTNVSAFVTALKSKLTVAVTPLEPPFALARRIPG